MSHVANQKKNQKTTSLHIWVRPSFSSKNDLRYEVLLIFINYQMQILDALYASWSRMSEYEDLILNSFFFGNEILIHVLYTGLYSSRVIFVLFHLHRRANGFALVMFKQWLHWRLKFVLSLKFICTLTTRVKGAKVKEGEYRYFLHTVIHSNHVAFVFT